MPQEWLDLVCFLALHNSCFQQQNCFLTLYFVNSICKEPTWNDCCAWKACRANWGCLTASLPLRGLMHSKFCSVSHLICNVHSKSQKHKKWHIKPVMAYDASYTVCWFSPQFWKLFICSGQFLWLICYLAPFSFHTVVLSITYIRWLPQALKSRTGCFCSSATLDT